MKQTLNPTMDDLVLECVLVQAWKKTSAHIRQHSWYSDTLELDYQSLRLPGFIRELQEKLQSPQSWVPTPLDLVPAPKAQRWHLNGDEWNPRPDEIVSRKLRPLAHVSLHDQVVATAMMMCLANGVETDAGDPRSSPKYIRNRKSTLAYGHRLFCDSENGRLLHRWGSSKLYRGYSQDYQTFLERPKLVAADHTPTENSAEIAIVHSDLSKFYDRVRPALLHEKVSKLHLQWEDSNFLELFSRVFNWTWNENKWAAKYGRDNEIHGFEAIALPQGLVSAGFFANVVMSDFEAVLRDHFGAVISEDPQIILLDACYYVDDLRLVVQINKGTEESQIEKEVCDWLQSSLDVNASGLKVELSKTKVTVEGRDKLFLVQQSMAASRIQKEVSGTFDMLHGTELVGAIEGFFHTQKRYTSAEKAGGAGRSGLLIGISDLRDDTAARFAAGKYRRTFRSLRPLLASEDEDESNVESGEEEEDAKLPFRLVLSREQLDEKAKNFAAMLIEEWVANPGNIRLLRIALDMYPEAAFLESVLSLLRDGWRKGGARSSKKEVRIYCLAEVFRAGATETGIVNDQDCLPSGVSIAEYHQKLTAEAEAILRSYLAYPRSTARLPWYLMQQVFLYLLARNELPEIVRGPDNRRVDRLARYKILSRFLAGSEPAAIESRCIYLILAVSAFGNSGFLEQIAKKPVSAEFLTALAQISPDVAERVWSHIADRSSHEQKAAARSLGLEERSLGLRTVSTVHSLSDVASNPFYDEDNLLLLADALLKISYTEWPEILTPWQVDCALANTSVGSSGSFFGRVKRGSIKISKRAPKCRHLFILPDWCESDEECQKQKLGMLLRCALRGSTDFHSRAVQSAGMPGNFRYKRPVSHWEQQRYSGFQGRAAFGPPWLPLSSVAEDILFDLLRWPGCGVTVPVRSLAEIRDCLRKRIKELSRKRGKATKMIFLDGDAPWPGKPPKAEWERPLRVGIVQSVVPDFSHYKERMTAQDPELLSDSPVRRAQRRHLASLLEGVSQMLRVRDTHRTQSRNDGRVLDLLVFPELAVHIQDLNTLIIPFVRSHKCIVLCGMVFHAEAVLPGRPLINSCMWIIPEWSRSGAFQVRIYEQGKQHLAAAESNAGLPIIGFRPNQWLIEYQWHSNKRDFRPLILSASVCYDATDLELVSDLRDRSDFYIVCALNSDVGTFDRMAEALHYHMFQAVMIVNNGQFGGSSLFFPFSEAYHRQVLHFHGQPQATIAFAEVCPRKLVDRPTNPQKRIRRSDVLNTDHPVGNWKTAPAGWIGCRS